VASQPTPGRLVLLSTTHRVPAGLLSHAAWSALAEAAEVCAGSADHPLAAALDAAGVTLRVPQDATDAPARASWLLRRTAAAGGDVVWLLAADGDAGLTDALAQALTVAAESGRPGPEVELVAGSWDLPGARLLDLVAVMDRLRSPGGCPWDAEQTHRSLLPYLLEEAYETVEAVETDDLDGLREELGDLLLQVVFHARLGEEHPDHPWSVDDVAAGIVDKLVARHPHVFRSRDGESGPTADQVDARWDELKRAEKGRRSAVDGVPLDQPALALAAKLLGRAERAGVAVPVPAPAPTPAGEPGEITEASVGDALLALVAAAVAAGVDPETALRATARRYAADVRQAEGRRRESGPTAG
jgi:XTP/dITP diphosphohydrolase